jgi:hypothetical protein
MDESDTSKRQLLSAVTLVSVYLRIQYRQYNSMLS